jgi:hypothetical protein
VSVAGDPVLACPSGRCDDRLMFGAGALGSTATVFADCPSTIAVE